MEIFVQSLVKWRGRVKVKEWLQADFSIAGATILIFAVLSKASLKSFEAFSLKSIIICY